MNGDFFTVESLGTLAGACAATLAIANTIQYLFNFNPHWLALAVAELICLGLVVVLQIDGTMTVKVTPYFVAFLNGFLVFCSAAGLTGVGHEAGRGSGAPRDWAGRRRGFWTPWLHRGCLRAQQCRRTHRRPDRHRSRQCGPCRARSGTDRRRRCRGHQRMAVAGDLGRGSGLSAVVLDILRLNMRQGAVWRGLRALAKPGAAMRLSAASFPRAARVTDRRATAHGGVGRGAGSVPRTRHGRFGNLLPANSGKPCRLATPPDALASSVSMITA